MMLPSAMSRTPEELSARPHQPFDGQCSPVLAASAKGLLVVEMRGWELRFFMMLSDPVDRRDVCLGGGSTGWLTGNPGASRC